MSGDGFDFDKECKNVTISNIIAKGRRGTSGDGFIEINGGKHFTISNITIDGAWYGLDINGKNVETEGLDYRTISEDIVINNCYISNCDHAVTLGNALGDSIQECKHIIINNVVASNIAYHAYNIRGENIKLSNCIALNGNTYAILINNKARDITIDGFSNYCKGFIKCDICNGMLSLINIVDNNERNTANQNMIENVENLFINGLHILKESSYSKSDNRLYYISVQNLYANNVKTSMLDTAKFKITATTKYQLSNCNFNNGDFDLSTPTLIFTETAFNDIKTIPYKTGTILCCGTVANTREVYLCTSGRLDTGAENTWAKLSLTGL
jgi:hypothetical protein